MKFIFLLVILFLCSSCAAMDPEIKSLAREPVAYPQKEELPEHFEMPAVQPETVPGPDVSEAELLNQRLQEIISASPLRTTMDIFAPAEEFDPAEAQDVSFSFYDADLVEVIHVFMQLMEEDYLIHPGVKGRVSLFLQDWFTPRQMLNVLEGVLRVNNVAMLKSNFHIWEFLPQSWVPRHIPAEFILLPDRDEPPRRGQIVQGFRLDFISAQEMLNILEPHLSGDARVYAHEATGVLLVADYPHALEKTQKLISLFDESVFADILARVFPLRYIEATEAAENLENILSRFGLERDAAGRQARVSFLPLERMNMLLAVTRNEHVLRFVQTWIEGLDQAVPEQVPGSSGESIYVYYVQYGDAEEIVESLRGVFDSGPDRNNHVRAEDLREISPENEQPSWAGPGHVSGGLAGPVRFTVDRATNSILTRCRAEDYARVQAVMEKLDLYPKQVLIEVIIAEVRLSDATKMGVDWQYILSFGDRLSGELRFDPAADALPGAGGVFRVESSRRLKAALYAAVDDAKLQILSTPTLLASDNRPATINIGDQVPFPTSTRQRLDDTDTSEVIDTTIQYRDTGIILRVTPKINRHGMVRMEIVQEVSSLTARRVEGITAPVINTRHAETTLAVDDQETIVIAGLMEQERSMGYSGVPGFRRIPVVKHLFGTSETRFENTELLVFITPHVIMSREDSGFLTRNFLTRLEELKERMK